MRGGTIRVDSNSFTCNENTVVKRPFVSSGRILTLVQAFYERRPCCSLLHPRRSDPRYSTVDAPVLHLVRCTQLFPKKKRTRHVQEWSRKYECEHVQDRSKRT